MQSFDPWYWIPTSLEFYLLRNTQPLFAVYGRTESLETMKLYEKSYRIIYTHTHSFHLYAYLSPTSDERMCGRDWNFFYCHITSPKATTEKKTNYALNGLITIWYVVIMILINRQHQTHIWWPFPSWKFQLIVCTFWIVLH